MRKLNDRSEYCRPLAFLIGHNMKYSILGFNQSKVLELQKEVTNGNGGKSMLVKIDAIDLLILRNIADFMNRRNIIKYIIDEKTYCSVKYTTIIEDLPILNLKQQALGDRLDKLCLFCLLEKAVVRNQSGTYTAFRIGRAYEDIVYDNGKVGTSSQLRLQTYSDTSANVVNYECYNNNNNNNNSSTINPSTNTPAKEEKEKKISTKKEKDALFEECWVSYNRKGSKAKSKQQWDKLSDDEKDKVPNHIRAYTISRERQYQKDFERYLRDKTFLDVVIDKRNTVVYDPSMFDGNKYAPQGSTIWFNKDTQSYWSDDYFYYGTISDGYDDNTRPDGATLTLNNGRGNIRWNRQTKKWEKA